MVWCQVVMTWSEMPQGARGPRQSLSKVYRFPSQTYTFVIRQLSKMRIQKKNMEGLSYHLNLLTHLLSLIMIQ